MRPHGEAALGGGLAHRRSHRAADGRVSTGVAYVFLQHQLGWVGYRVSSPYFHMYFQNYLRFSILYVPGTCSFRKSSFYLLAK